MSFSKTFIIAEMACSHEGDMSLAKNDIKPPEHHDIPGDWFKGPF